ncbi:MAG: hypothetical protein FWE05_09615 [Defluviitaleaceae bacterium]|nr:hypothetical protein [Defluviitaleaceae bacterium]
MGTWGHELYDNDITCDIRDSYIGFLQDKVSDKDAYDKILELYHECIGDEYDEPLFWYALADTQWGVGRLTAEVKEQALNWIENDGGVSLWEGSDTDSSNWRKTLKKLKIKLEKTMPSKKRIRKPVAVNQNLWNMGDVYAYQFHTEESKEYGVYGKYMLIQKMGEGHAYWSELEEEPIMRVHVFDKLFDYTPTITDIKRLRLLPLGYPRDTDNLFMNRLAKIWSKKDYPKKHLTFIGNTIVPLSTVIVRHYDEYFDWKHIESHCCMYYQYWQGKAYETIGEGLFRYINFE